MKKGLYFLIIFFIGVSAYTASSQVSVSDTAMNIPMFYATYAFQIPGGDMAERYGPNSGIGGGFSWKTNTNWMVGTEFLFLFGNQVKISDQILYNLKTSNGNIINMAGNYTNFAIMQRGYTIAGKVGKLFPVLSPNPNSGIVLMGSLGYMQHKIRIEVEKNTAPQIDGDYKKGYDRLAGGFTISEFLGYQFTGNSRLFNFFGGVEFYQAWTKAKREVNFDTREPDTKKNRFDLLFGIKVGWIIPIFQRLPEKYYYF